MKDFPFETEERRALREAVGAFGRRYGAAYMQERARAGESSDELWREAGRLGYLGVSLPEEYGGGGGGIADLVVVLEELATAGCPLLLLVVTPAICGSIISRFGTEEQKRRHLPGFADGTVRMAFGITEPDAGRTRTGSPRPPGATGTTGYSTGARSSSRPSIPAIR